MAVWQFKIHVVPAANVRVGSADVIRLTRDQVDAAQRTFTPAEIDAVSGQLSDLLPEKKSWSAELRVWGDEKSDDVQVWFDGGSVECVDIRLDLRHLSLTLVSGLCAIARASDWLLVTTDGVVIRPNTEAVVQALVKSPAQRFVDDPYGFLAEVGSDAEQE